jgi:hypothetical protein
VSRRVRVVLILSLAICLSITTVGLASKDVSSIAKKILPGTVLIQTYDASGRALGQGSGFFVSEKGDIVTCYHVLRGYSSANVTTSDKKEYRVKNITAINKTNDLIKISLSTTEHDFSSLKLNTTLPEVGQEIVVVVGGPLGLENTVSEGIVSAIRENETQITAPISQGSSGGPVANMKGEVIGIVAAQMKIGQNLNFAIPAKLTTTMQPASVEQIEEIMQPAKQEMQSSKQEIKQKLGLYNISFALDTPTMCGIHIDTMNGVDKNNGVKFADYTLLVDTCNDSSEYELAVGLIEYILNDYQTWTDDPDSVTVRTAIKDFEENQCTNVKLYQLPIDGHTGVLGSCRGLIGAFYFMGSSYSPQRKTFCFVRSILPLEVTKKVLETLHVEGPATPDYSSDAPLWAIWGYPSEEAFHKPGTSGPSLTSDYNSGCDSRYAEKYEEAIQCYDCILKKNPSYGPSWNNKGVALYKLNRFEEALVCFNNSIEDDSSVWEYWQNKAATLWKLHRETEAELAFSKPKIYHVYSGKISLLQDPRPSARGKPTVIG